MALFKIVSRVDATNILYEGEANSLKNLVGMAVKSGANLDGANLDGVNLVGANLDGAYLRGALLRGAYLDGAYLRGVNLDGANLDGAYLRGVNLRDANLRGALLRGANLDGAYLRGANLDGANLDGAYLRSALLRGGNLDGAYLGRNKIIAAKWLSGLYEYTVIPHVTESGEQRIIMGCHNRTLAEWEADEWNNPSEFPNDGSEKSEDRHAALEFAKGWLNRYSPAPTKGENEQGEVRKTKPRSTLKASSTTGIGSQ